MEYSKEDLMEAKRQILGVGENMGTEETETPATRPSVLAALGEKTNQPEPVKPFRSYYDKDGDAR